MTFKALAIDLDGTLLVGERLPERNREAVLKASQAGYKVIVATARWRQLAEGIGKQIGLIGQPVIACSGAQVYSTAEARDIFDSRLPATFAEKLFDICNVHRCIASATLDNHTVLKMQPKPDAEYLTDEMLWVESFAGLGEELPRIATVQGTDAIKAVRELHDGQHLAEVNIFDSIGPSGRLVITITGKAADKGTALARACEYLDIEAAEVIAFGDAGNDVEMFRRAGRSVAMGQADEAVKAAATDVTSAFDDDGVARFIESELLD